MMQATAHTECHLHERGASTFLALGTEHGFSDPSGGTFLGHEVSDTSAVPLQATYQKSNEILDIGAGVVHAFFADPGTTLTLIGLVTPRIRHNDRFDVVAFDLITAGDVTEARRR
jgi:hypothetical protein